MCAISFIPSCVLSLVGRGLSTFWCPCVIFLQVAALSNNPKNLPEMVTIFGQILVVGPPPRGPTFWAPARLSSPPARDGTGHTDDLLFFLIYCRHPFSRPRARGGARAESSTKRPCRSAREREGCVADGRPAAADASDCRPSLSAPRSTTSAVRTDAPRRPPACGRGGRASPYFWRVSTTRRASWSPPATTPGGQCA